MRKMMMCFFLGAGLGIFGFKWLNKSSKCLDMSKEDYHNSKLSKECCKNQEKSKLESVIEELDSLDLSEVKVKTKDAIDSMKKVLKSIKI